MKPIYGHLAGALAMTFTIAACVPAPAPTPAPTPVRTARPPPPPPPPPQVVAPNFENWIDAPQTPGNWRYAAAGGVTRATFSSGDGAVRFAMMCDPRAGRIELSRAGTANALTIRTETAARTLSASGTAQQMPMTVAQIAPRDPLLDAMALTRGRFAVESPGLPALYLPAWGEVTRVIEDCR